MFFNFKKLYFFCGCIISFIQNYASDSGPFMELGIVNFQKLKAELDAAMAQLDKKFIEEFATKRDIQLLNKQLDEVEKKLNYLISFQAYEDYLCHLSRRCTALEDDNIRLKKDLVALQALMLENKNDCNDLVLRATANSTEHSKKSIQSLFALVTRLQERVRSLEEDSGDPVPFARSQTPRPGEAEKHTKVLPVVLSQLSLDANIQDYESVRQIYGSKTKSENRVQALPWKRVS